MALSVEDDELTAEPPTNDAVDRRAQTFSDPHHSIFSAGLRRFMVLVGKVRGHRLIQSCAANAST